MKKVNEKSQPSYKLAEKGVEALDEVELICLLLGNQNDPNAKAFVQKVFADLTLTQISALGYDGFKASGFTARNAAALSAAFELHKRKQRESTPTKMKIQSSREVFDLFKTYINDLEHEEFWILVLNRGNRVERSIKISSGGMAGTVVDSKMVYKEVLKVKGGAAIILVHNHPSGNRRPSPADIELNKKLKSAGDLLDVAVLDHIIIAHENGYYSFADEGII